MNNEGVTLAVVGLLGGATKQAVSQAQNPYRWLCSRLRQELSLSPGSGPGSYQRKAVTHFAALQAKKYFQAIELRLKQLPAPLAPDPHRRGRPRVNLTPAALAAFLKIKPGKTLGKTFEAFLMQCLSKLIALLIPDSFTRQELDQLLDTCWLPFRPREGCLPNPGIQI
jgi:hypothetical protein